MKKLYSLDPPPQNGRDWSSLMSKMDMGRRRQGWLCPVPFDAGQITSMSLYPVGRWDNLVSFYFKRLRMVWWQPWRESPSPLLTCCCLMPRSSNPFPPCAWTWRETAMPSRMWMPLRCRALLTHFFHQSWQIDPLGRLWVVDSGQTAPFSRPHRECPPKILVFNLAKGQWLTWLISDPFSSRKQIGDEPCSPAQSAHTVQANRGGPFSRAKWRIRLPQWLCKWESPHLQVEASSHPQRRFSVAKPPVTIMCMTAKKDITVIIVKPLQPEIWQVLGNPDWGDPACQQSVSSGEVTHPNNWKCCEIFCLADIQSSTFEAVSGDWLSLEEKRQKTKLFPAFFSGTLP